MFCIVKECRLTDIYPTNQQLKHYETNIVVHIQTSELLLVTRSNDNHSPGPVMREVSP